MIDSASDPDPQIGRPSDPTPSTEKNAWRRALDLARDSSRGLLLRLLSGKRSALVAMIAVLALPIGVGIIWFVASPSGIRKSQAGKSGAIPSFLLSHGTKAKPAPGKPMIAAAPPAPVQPPPVPVSPSMPAPRLAAPPQTAAPNASGIVAPAPIAGAAPPAPAPALAVVPQHSMVYQARHDKAFGGGCSGQLTLSPSGLAFNCLDDPHGSMQIALNQIGAADENGVRLFSGKRYHFSIRGMTKTGEEALFLNWLHQVR